MARPKKEVSNRSDGRFEVKVVLSHTFDGKAIRKSFYSEKSRADARAKADEWLAERRAAALAGLSFSGQATTFCAWAEKWLELFKKGKVRDNTFYGSYEVPVKLHLIPYFGAAKLDDILPADIQAFFDKKKDEGYALETLKKMRSCLFGIFTTAMENNLCRKNPITKSITLTSAKKAAEKRAYTKEERDRVIEFARGHKDGLAIILMLRTGITRSELLGIKWEDVDTAARTVAITRGVTDTKSTATGKIGVMIGETKNEFRNRILPIDDDTTAMFEELRKKRALYVGGNKKKRIPGREVLPEFVFHNSDGGAFCPKNWYNRVYKPFMEEMHRENPDIAMLSPHELRHTFATIANNNGTNLFILSKMMGHADTRMLYKRYAHTNAEDLRKGLVL